MSNQTVKKLFSLWMPPGGSGGFNYSFCTLFKNLYETINPYLITLKFGTDKQQNYKANFHTKFYLNQVVRPKKTWHVNAVSTLTGTTKS